MMTHRQALEPVAIHRKDRVVIPTMGSVAIWPSLSDGPRDFHYLPSSMGQAVPVALGLALAKPGLGAIVLSGDGGLLMNLGCLVTLADRSVPVAVVVIVNGLYEVTGGQAVAGAGRVDFAGLAAASGIKHVGRFADAGEWAAKAEHFLTRPEPSFVALQVVGERGKKTPSAPRPMAEQIARLQQSITIEQCPMSNAPPMTK